MFLRKSLLSADGGTEQYTEDSSQESVADPNVKITEEQQVLNFDLWRAVEKNDVDDISRALAARADINSKDESGDTALHIAVKKRNEVAIELLLRHGANPLLKNLQGYSAFDEATVMLQNITILRLFFVAGVDINQFNAEGKTALHTAAEIGNVDTIEYLLLRDADVDLLDLAFKQ